MKDKIKEGLNGFNLEALHDDEIFNYIHLEVECHYYDKSPMVLADEFQSQLFVQPRMMSSKRFSEIRRALSYVPDKQVLDQLFYNTSF